MINDIKLGFKILKYGLNVTLSVIAGGIFFALGFLMDIAGYVSSLGNVYIALVTIFFGQILHSIVQSTMVQTSPRKKKLVTRLPALVMAVVLLVYHTVVLAIRCISVYADPEQKPMIVNGLILGGIMVIVIQVYFAFAMKVYWPATICFFIVFYGIAFGTDFGTAFNIFEDNMGLGEKIPFAAAILFYYLSILIGFVANYGVNVLLYNKDYSPQNFKRVLDRVK